MNAHYPDTQGFCRIESGRLESIGITELYRRPVQQEVAEESIRFVPPDHVTDGLADLLAGLTLRGAATHTTLVPENDFRLIPERPPANHYDMQLIRPGACERSVEKRVLADLTLTEFEKRTYRVVTADSGRLEIELPPGMPRVVNARTLKAMLGADADDILFRKTGARWEICPDACRVDLENRSEVFRLGQVEINS